MKTLLKFTFLFIFAFTSCKIFGQDLPVDAETKLISYTKVVDAPETSKAELYSRANEWFAKNYKSAQSVLQMQDKEAGKLVGKAICKTTLRGYDAGYVNYTISIFVKDNKYKYEVTNLYHDKGLSQIGSGGVLENEKPDCGGLKMFTKQWLTIKTQTDADVNALIANLTLAMSEKVKAKDDF